MRKFPRALIFLFITRLSEGSQRIRYG